MLTTLSLATCFLCLLSWPLVRRTRAGSLGGLLTAVSFTGFLACAWFAAPGAMDAF